MSTFTFQPETRPYPRWMGPFSPSRGNKTGFRFHDGRLGTWVTDDEGSEFWYVQRSQGAREIEILVRGEWGGGRVLFLPNGLVIKPLPGDEEVGQRVIIGRFSGTIVLEDEYGGTFNLNEPDTQTPGGAWHGPTTVGLECVMKSSGCLNCSWYHPTQWGRDEETRQLAGPNPGLAAGFRRARPRHTGGRVRITPHGHITTNKKTSDGWVSRY